MTFQILTPQPTEYSLPEAQRLALLPPPKSSLKVKSVTKGRNTINQKKKVEK